MTVAASPGSVDNPRERVEAFVRAVNSAHDTRFSLAGRLPGGYQTGAYKLVDEAGRPTVLKWWTAARPLERVIEAAETVAAARAAGWPTPAWLYYGLGPDSMPYEIQEFVRGSHRTDLDEETSISSSR